MSNYVKATNFTSKDALAIGNPLKIIKGTEFDVEFNAIATAVATKADVINPTFSGTVTGTFSGALTGNVTGNVTGSSKSLATTNFSIVESGGKLYFKYGATNIASMDSSGNFVALNNITGYGTP